MANYCPDPHGCSIIGYCWHQEPIITLAPFDWNNAWACIADAGDLQKIIEAAFVSVERYNERTETFRLQLKIAVKATARAEAAEARNKMLEEALRKIDQMSGSHDAVGHVARQALGDEHEVG